MTILWYRSWLFFDSFNWPRLPSWVAWRWQWQHVRAALARSSKQNTRANISVFCLQIWPSIKSRAINSFNKVYLAFIHIGRYDIKARRHLACVQNGITQLGDWRMETWQLAPRARCHVSIRQSPSLCNAILNMIQNISGIGVWRHDNSPYGLVVMSPSANLPRCVMPFWTHAYAFSLYHKTLSFRPRGQLLLCAMPILLVFKPCSYATNRSNATQ